jgi:hypothetical protein
MSEPGMSPGQALALLAQLVNQTPALPAQIDAFREALSVLADVVNQVTASTDGG